MSIFVRQLGAITCEVKFDRHCNWIVTVIAWNVPLPPASLISDACPHRENKDIWLLYNLRMLETTRWRGEVFALECASVELRVWDVERLNKTQNKEKVLQRSSMEGKVTGLRS